MNGTKDSTKLRIIKTKIVELIDANIVTLTGVLQHFEDIASYCYLRSILKILNSALDFRPNCDFARSAIEWKSQKIIEDNFLCPLSALK